MTTKVKETTRKMLLGDEAVALGAVHAGITGAYAYPGTPATEIVEFLIQYSAANGAPRASWCANEKTAYEAALGMSMAGKRSLVSMKHVGLNVAADPFMNSAVVSPRGGIVVAVADDPGMHSSQNEQDSRYYADFARIPCLEPADPQEAYDMTREAYELSERFRIPVMVRLVTRIAHQRAGVEMAPPVEPKAVDAALNRREWVLLPAFARVQWKKRIAQSPEITAWAAESKWSTLELNESFRELGVITTGIAKHYFLEVAGELGLKPSHLHIGAYPMPVEKIRALFDHCDEILVIEDGYPYVERYLRGVLPTTKPINGKMSGTIPPDGELGQDVVRRALGLAIPESLALQEFELPGRPPRLCDGCAHNEAFDALALALEGIEGPIVTADIGCYTLGALPPHEIGDSCVCMGASVSMAKGAADAGAWPVVGVIGDSTFLHSGITPLLDAVVENTNMTLVILDNSAVAMTGAQPTLLPPEKFRELVLGLGADPEHVHAFESHPRKVQEIRELLRKEIEHKGLSVVILQRECIEAARKRRKK
jgi:indolepyruvate ferredoxin oxidoreductase, alpha subunit